MEIVFGWSLDGLAYPENARRCTASFNSQLVGPLSFLSLLETRLGLRGPSVPRAVRIADYLSMLALASKDVTQFYSASFSADAWGTADHLLSMRDELMASGWNGAAIDPARSEPDGVEKLNALARVEKSGTISAGFGERIQTVNTRLAARIQSSNKLLIDSVRIIEPLRLLPQIWQETLRLLAESGSKIEQVSALPKALTIASTSTSSRSTSSDLQILQECLLQTRSSRSSGSSKTLNEVQLSNVEKRELSGDGTVSVIDADDEIQAAFFTAAWLAQRSNRADLVLLRGADCSMLAQACDHYSLPSPGSTARLQFKAILQVLPLAFKLACRPLDPNIMMEFASIQGGPLPRFVAQNLIYSISQAPGIDSAFWNEAWQKSLNSQKSFTSKDHPELTNTEVVEASAKKIEEQRNWFKERVAPSERRMKKSDAEEICSRIEKWAMSRSPDENRALYELAAGQSKMLRQLIAQLRDESICLIQLRKMIESVTSYGSSVSTADAADWSLVDKAGQIWDAAPTILWWGFAQSQWTAFRTSIWSEAEIELLKRHKIILEGPSEKLQRESFSWRMPVINAQERIILVKPRVVAGRRATAHPLWDEISTIFNDRSLLKITTNASSIFAKPSIQIAGSEIKSQKRQRIQLPGRLRTWTLAPELIKARPKESFSSIEKLLGCPLAWTLQYSAGMWQPKSLDLPQKQMLLGRLAHAVVNHIYDKKKVWEPEEAQEAAAEAVAYLVPKMAAGLLLPGASPQLREATEAVPASVFQLAKFLDGAGATVEGTEISLSARLPQGVEISGAVDMLIRLPSGSRAVIDFKWSSAPYWYRRKMVDGKALQLAIYSWLAQQTEENDPSSIASSAAQTALSAVRDSNNVLQMADRFGAGASHSTLHSNLQDPLPPAGFFMFRHSELFFTSDGVFPQFTLVRKMARTLDETFQLTLQAYEKTISDLQAGKVTATGITDDSLEPFMNTELNLVEAPCNFCKLGTFCGMKELT